MHRTVPWSFVLCVTLSSVVVPAQAQVVVRGLVQDAQTGEPLPAAHVQVADRARGSITNAVGRFELVVPALPVELVIRYIGYRTERIHLAPGDSTDLLVDLEPAVIPLDELVVTGDDFADNIMRKVIAQKRAWRSRLDRHEAQGYTKVVLENASEIVLLSESVFDVYLDRERGTREVVRSWRRTSDLYEAFRIAPAGHIPDLYDDVVEIQGIALVGPTHPQALDYYDFTLAGRRMLDDRVVYDLYVAPRTLQHPTFIGRVSVLDEAYALLEAELRPGRHVTFAPPIAAWDVFYTQQFACYGDGFWLPVDLRLEGTVQVARADATYPRATFSQVSRLSDYRINEPLPPEPFAAGDRVIVDEASVLEDYLFLMGRHIVPLTPREAEALERLRRNPPRSLEDAFPPAGRRPNVVAFEAARYADDRPQFTWPRLLAGYTPWVWFNRVDGYAAGITRYLNLPPHFFGELRLAQTTGARAPGFGRIRTLTRAQYRWGRGGLAEAGFTASTDAQGTGSLYPLALNTLPGRLGPGDYFDFYWNRRFYAEAGYRFPRLRFTAGLRDEQHTALERDVATVWPFDDTLRTNPPVDEGRLRSVTLSAAFGDGFRPFRAGGIRRIGVDVEHALPWLGSAFRFTQLRGTLDWRFPTLYRNRLRPNALDVRAFAGTGTGTLPVQRLGLLDNRLGPFSTFGAFRSGPQRPYAGTYYAGIFWEHDFTTVPFEWLGLRPLVARQMGVVLFGSHGRTRVDPGRVDALYAPPHAPSGWHHEAGLALTNLFGTPLRLDLTYRLDEPGFVVGIGLSRF